MSLVMRLWMNENCNDVMIGVKSYSWTTTKARQMSSMGSLCGRYKLGLNQLN